MGDAIGPGDRNQFGVRIDRRPGFDFRGELARFLIIHGGPHPGNFHEAEIGGSTDQTRKQMQSSKVDGNVRSFVDPRGDGSDPSVAHQHITGRQGSVGHGMDRGPAQQQGAGGRPRGGEQQNKKNNG